jgi:uncharacterized protein YbjT (DUF2867 family)
LELSRSCVRDKAAATPDTRTIRSGPSWTYGALRRLLPTCATRDIAVVAAGLLLDDSWAGQGDVPVLGPEHVSFEDMAQVMTEVLGTAVRFQQISGDAFKVRLTGSGMSDRPSRPDRYARTPMSSAISSHFQ